MINPYTAENFDEGAQAWANAVMEAKRHVTEHHERNSEVDIYDAIAGNICNKAWSEHCEIHQVLYMDAALAAIVSLMTNLRETNPTMTSENVLRNFDSLIAAQRHMLQAFLWEIDMHGTLDHLDLNGGIGEVQGNA